MSTKKSWIFVKSLEKVLKKSWIWFWKFCGHPGNYCGLEMKSSNVFLIPKKRLCFKNKPHVFYHIWSKRRDQKTFMHIFFLWCPRYSSNYFVTFKSIKKIPSGVANFVFFSIIMYLWMLYFVSLIIYYDKTAFPLQFDASFIHLS